MKSNYSVKVREKLKKDISSLHYNEHCEIFNIIRKDTDKISENNNGIFVNLKNLKDETIEKIQEFINFSQQNKNLLKKKEKLHNKELESVNKKHNNSNISNIYNTYEKYNAGKESIDDLELEFNEIMVEDKFSFKNYMDKLSISSSKDFENDSKKKKNSKRTRKLSGVNARILKKCRNLNKLNRNNKLKKKIENILDNNIDTQSLNDNYNTPEQLSFDE
jgi:hypothetical protein